jgi:heme-degrading monooxygenase HmoA
MAYIHIAASRGATIDDFRATAAKHNPPQDIDGLLAWAVGTDADGLHVVTVWESQAHAERWQAEQLFPAFQSLGVMSNVMDNTDFVTYDTDEFFLRS